MKNKKVSIKIILVLLVILTSIALILIKFDNKNANIEKQEISKEQLTETTESNSYVTMADHLSEVSKITSNTYKFDKEYNTSNSTKQEIAATKTFEATSSGQLIVIATAAISGGTNRYNVSVTKNGESVELTNVFEYTETAQYYVLVDYVEGDVIYTTVSTDETISSYAKAVSIYYIDKS